MLLKDKQRLLNYYNDSLKEYGEGAQSVHWLNQNTQKIRFEILSKVANLNNKSILDVGCGLGDYYKFLISKNINVDYTGIDIVPKFIEKAHKFFPSLKFQVKDVSDLDKNYDYILASGAFSFRVEDSKNYYFSLIRKMFEHARYGIAFNMLNSTIHNTDETYFAYNIDEVLVYCKTMTDNVQVVSNYLPQDFTVYMYKQNIE